MNRFSGSRITQQMYTRERRGVYRATEGFDTVAKSESLDNNFVKKIIHPFCLYDAPAELAARGEKMRAVSGRAAFIPYGNKRHGDRAKPLSGD